MARQITAQRTGAASFFGCSQKCCQKRYSGWPGGHLHFFNGRGRIAIRPDREKNANAHVPKTRNNSQKKGAPFRSTPFF